MPEQRGYPLDYQAQDYRYIERPNAVLLSLVEAHLLTSAATPRILDVGAGAGANLRAIQRLAPSALLTAVEPNAQAAALLKQVCNNVHNGTLQSFLQQHAHQPFDAVLLSDVVEHVAEPVAFLRALRDEPSLRRALFFVSIPNYAVWYNRLATMFGHFEYTWSGLYDRTHLRFFTRASQNRLFSQLGFELIEQRATPSLAQSLAPWIRRAFESDVDAGQHLSLQRSPSYRAYTRFIEPLEARMCNAWPELLGFQIVSALRVRR
ncbi:MAG: class I SAM-dependent methyltransferase [Myxococcota bacterium]